MALDEQIFRLCETAGILGSYQDIQQATTCTQLHDQHQGASAV